MKRSLFSWPDDFALFPMLVMLPRRGNIDQIRQLTSAFFARYERVKGRKRDQQTAGGDSELRQRLNAEEAMLAKVLDWAAMKPDDRGNG